MTTFFYYHVTDPARIAAVAAYRARSKTIKQAAEQFAAQFLGPDQIARPIYWKHSGGLMGIEFVPPIRDDMHWCKPSSEAGTQRPRSAPLKPRGVKLTEEQKAAHEDLVKRWESGFPKDTNSFDEVAAEVLGTCFDFTCGAKLTELDDDTILVASSKQAAEGTSGVIEILGSTYASVMARQPKSGKTS